eukprot:6404007-Prorocentrum_lima.AAC.1
MGQHDVAATEDLVIERPQQGVVVARGRAVKQTEKSLLGVGHVVTIELTEKSSELVRLLNQIAQDGVLLRRVDLQESVHDGGVR